MARGRGCRAALVAVLVDCSNLEFIYARPKRDSHKREGGRDGMVMCRLIPPYVTTRVTKGHSPLRSDFFERDILPIVLDITSALKPRGLSWKVSRR